MLPVTASKMGVIHSFFKPGVKVEMRGIPVSEKCRVLKATILYTVGLLNTAVCRPAVLIFNKLSV